MDNAITVEGALLIVKSAVDNAVCPDVEINYEYRNDEVEKMLNILKDRRRQHKSLLLRQITESIMESINNSRGEELVHELPVITGGGATVNMEKLMSHSEDDDHSGGQEETRGTHDVDSLSY